MVGREEYFAPASSDEESASSGPETAHKPPMVGSRTRSVVSCVVAAVLLACTVLGASVLWSGRNVSPTEFEPLHRSGGPGQSPEDDEAAMDKSLRSVSLRAQASGSKGRWLKLQGGHKIPVAEGEAIELAEKIPVGKCTEACGARPECKYVITCGGGCYLKVKAIDWLVETKSNSYCDAWLYTTETYFPADPALLKPSNSPTYTFYMYRTQGPASPRGDYPLENVNTASASGVLWYLQHEMIPYCWNNGQVGERRFGVTRIKRFKVTMKTPQPLLDKGMHFGSLCSFDSGECTGPHRQRWNRNKDWDEFGFHVGCGNLGDYPHEDWRSGKRYKNATWYSLPGSCPTMRYNRATEQCTNDLPGGLCDEVTGQGNCTYSIKDAGEIDIDELVGIKPRWASRAEFCKAGCNEGEKGWDENKRGTVVPYIFDDSDDYDEQSKKGCTKWWANIWNPIENEVRLQKMLHAFETKYPHMPSEKSLPAPTCDFNVKTWWR